MWTKNNGLFMEDDIAKLRSKEFQKSFLKYLLNVFQEIIFKQELHFIKCDFVISENTVECDLPPVQSIKQILSEEPKKEEVKVSDKAWDKWLL